jgi:hypothetical protein
MYFYYEHEARERTERFTREADAERVARQARAQRRRRRRAQLRWTPTRQPVRLRADA